MNIVNLNNKVIEYVLGYDNSDEVKQKLRNLDGSLSARKIADFGFIGVDGMMFVMNSNDRGQYYFSGPITMDEASSYVAMKFKINTIPYVLNVARITELNTTSVTESQLADFVEKKEYDSLVQNAMGGSDYSQSHGRRM